jgi:hypothetical protein
MAERNEKIQNRVREALEKNPELSSRELFETMKSEEPAAVSDETLRSFHARYVLSLKRGKRGASKRPARGGTVRRGAARSSGRGGKRQREADANRMRVRGILLKFAGEVASAETRAEVVNVVGSVDAYVDEVLG